MQKSLVRVVTVRKHLHNGKPQKLNDEYETDEDGAAELEALGYVTRVLEAKRTYKRRDLQADQ